jgi:nucleoside-triphosphatase THEP1
MTHDTVLPIAAIVYKPTDHIEPVLIDAARALAERGVKLGGILQHDIPTTIDDPCGMELEDLASGERFALSQDLGSGSEACRLDPDALAQAAVAVRHALERGAELVFINKFGGQEACGCGLRDEMGLAVASGVPVITAVGERFLDEWQRFTGGGSTLLPPDAAAILGWWDAVRRAPR